MSKSYLSDKEMKVYVAIGMYGGCIEQVRVFLQEEDAEKFKRIYEKNYGKDCDISGTDIFPREIVEKSALKE